MEKLHSNINDIYGIANSESNHELLVSTQFEEDSGIFWCDISAKAPSNFTPALVAQLRAVQKELVEESRASIQAGNIPKISYQILSSSIPEIFSLGGDLGLFRQYIREQNREGLVRYAKNCIDLIYSTAVGYKLPITTISLVQGGAFGGGFEAAMAGNVLVAERQAKMGFPEILFNMFPGMGAYTLLCRRMAPTAAERIIQSGRTYSAEELYDLGIVDVLADRGEGREAVYNYVRAHSRRQKGNNALRDVVRRVAPISYEELLDVLGIWVDTALSLSDRDLAVMQRLADAQDRESQATITDIGGRQIMAMASSE